MNFKILIYIIIIFIISLFEVLEFAKSVYGIQVPWI